VKLSLNLTRDLQGVFLTIAAKLLQGLASSSSEPVSISKLNALIDQGGITNSDVPMVSEAGSDLDGIVTGNITGNGSGNQPEESHAASPMDTSLAHSSLNKFKMQAINRFFGIGI
jgi:hypothetical protein